MHYGLILVLGVQGNFREMSAFVWGQDFRDHAWVFSSQDNENDLYDDDKYNRDSEKRVEAYDGLLKNRGNRCG